MANYNRVILAGNLTRDPELSYTPSGTPICKFGLAVNRTWTDRQTNERREETMFIDCVAWSRSGEVINQYSRKGRPLLIEGRLNYDTWTTPEGQKRSRHTVVVDTFQFLGGGGGGASSRDDSAAEPQPAAPPGPDEPPF
jgi:single-strand DNA-binding protein